MLYFLHITGKVQKNVMKCAFLSVSLEKFRKILQKMCHFLHTTWNFWGKYHKNLAILFISKCISGPAVVVGVTLYVLSISSLSEVEMVQKYRNKFDKCIEIKLLSFLTIDWQPQFTLILHLLQNIYYICYLPYYI